MEILLRSIFSCGAGKTAVFLLLFVSALSGAEPVNVGILDIGGTENACSFDEKVYSEISTWLARSANLRLPAKMKKVSLKDELGLYPVMLLSCSLPPAELDFGEIVKFRKYFSSGGNLIINDTSAKIESPLYIWAQKFSSLVLNSEIKTLRSEESFFKSFFIINRPFGRYIFSALPEGAEYDGRKAVLFFRNDIYSVWMRDASGKYLYKCIPGGEAQREMSRRALLNALMYFLTGDYKSDAIHQPLIMDRIRKIDSQIMEY